MIAKESIPSAFVWVTKSEILLMPSSMLYSVWTCRWVNRLSINVFVIQTSSRDIIIPKQVGPCQGKIHENHNMCHFARFQLPWVGVKG